jgi:16S rRNA (guanine966-N2)-methyltransferase
VRPTADRIREALFARIEDVEGARVLDLYAGTGALGIEALSRGAASAVFVERSRRILGTLKRNLVELGLAPVSRSLQGDAPAVVARLAREEARFELVLLDPPYDSPEVSRALRALASSGILAAEATVVVETSRHTELPEVSGLARRDERRYGDTRMVWLAPAGSGGEKGGTVER